MKVGDTSSDFPAIHLQLSLTWTSKPNTPCATTGCRTTRLACEVRPRTGQARQTILVLGQFHLQRAFPCAGMLREDVQYQSGPIQDLDVFIPDGPFKFSLLSRGQFFIENDDLSSGVGSQCYQFQYLA
jgi:hypothetical protein